MIHQRMMGHPEAPNHQKAEDEGEETGEQVNQCFEEGSGILNSWQVRHLDFQNQQRDCDGEHGV